MKAYVQMISGILRNMEQIRANVNRKRSVFRTLPTIVTKKIHLRCLTGFCRRLYKVYPKRLSYFSSFRFRNNFFDLSNQYKMSKQENKMTHHTSKLPSASSQHVSKSCKKRQYCQDVTGSCFQAKGILKASNVGNRNINLKRFCFYC